VVEVSLEEFLGDRVSAHGLEGQYVLAHQVEVFPGAAQLGAFSSEYEIVSNSFGIFFL
jgi:hypothetical protein